MFWSYLCQYLSMKSTRCPTDKKLKDTVHFFKTSMIHPSTVPISNVKLKRVSKVCHVLYRNSAGKTSCTNYNIQNNSQEKYAVSYITFI